MAIELVVDPRTIAWPHNPITERAFHKGNASRLVEAMTENRWTSGEFATFVQWRNAGRIVRQGEHGTKCLLPTITKTDDGGELVSGKIRREFTVFAIEQTKPIPTVSA
jgi:antirestriction protein ArdC